MKNRGAWPTVAVFASLVVLFIGERIIGEGTGQKVAAGLAGLLLLAAVAVRVLDLQIAVKGARTVETWLLASTIGVLVSVVLYAISTDWGLDALGLQGDARSRVGGSFAVLSPAIGIVSLVTLVFMEAAYRRMPLPEAVELRRVRAAAQGGASLALCLVFLASINYVATQRDIKRDLSYFKTTRPSDTTLRMVRNLGEPMRIILFYPKVNEVLDQIEPFFQEIDRASDKIEVLVRDHALSPELAREHRVRDNGTVVLLRGEGDSEQAETFEVGTELEVARSRLRTLDGRFQQSFSRLTTIRRMVYLTTGHGEHSASGTSDEPPEDRIRDLDSVLKRSNIEIRPYGLAEGLGAQVPDEAPMVMVVGPKSRFLPEEVQALIRYFHHGGRLLLMLDPDVDVGLTPLLHALGLQFRNGIAISTTDFYRRTNTEADRELIVTKNYGTHPTVTRVSRMAGRVATVFVRAGALDRYQGPDLLPYITIDFPMTSGITFFADEDGDRERDDNEIFDHLNLMAALTVRNADFVEGADGEDQEEGRAIVIPDGEFATDQVLGNDGNILVIADILEWFLGQEEIVGDTSSEEDIRIEHTREQDKMWFYGTSAGAPLPLLGIGVFVLMRRRRKSGKGSRV